MRKLLLLSVCIYFMFGIIFSAEQHRLKELPQKRTKYSKTIKSNKDNYELVIFNNPRHFRDKSGKWKNIEPDFIQYENGYANFSNTIKTIIKQNEIRLISTENLTFSNFSISKNNTKIPLPLFDQIEKISPNVVSLNGSGKFKVISEYGRLRFEFDLSNNDLLTCDLKLNNEWTAEKRNNRILIKNREGIIVYKLNNPKIVISSKVVAYGDYFVHKTDNGIKLVIDVPNNFKSLENSLIILEVTSGFEPDVIETGGVYKSYINNDSSVSATKTGSWVGRYIESDTVYYSYRAYQFFDISTLSSTTVIDSANYKITFASAEESFYVDLNHMSNSDQSTPNALWNDCKNGYTYDTFNSNAGIYSKKYLSSSTAFYE